MASARILFHRLARQEYQKAFGWYARRSPQVAFGFENEVDRALQRIAAPPIAGLYSMVLIVSSASSAIPTSFIIASWIPRLC